MSTVTISLSRTDTVTPATSLAYRVTLTDRVAAPDDTYVDWYVDDYSHPLSTIVRVTHRAVAGVTLVDV